jgi:hypothetical protein
MRILVHTQTFEDYNWHEETPTAYMKFKGGDTYECIVPDDTREQNVICAMFLYINSLILDDLKEQNINNLGHIDFARSWEVMEDSELTEMEKQYDEYGEVYPLTKLQFNPDAGNVTKI